MNPNNSNKLENEHGLRQWPKIMMREKFSEKIKQEAMTIKEFVDMDFENTICFEEPLFYNRYKDPRYGSWDGILYEVELKDIIDDRIPDWVYNEEYTEEEKDLLDKIYDDVFPDLVDEYICAWDSMTEDYYNNRRRDAEKKLGTDERWQEYQEARDGFERARDSYYGWCMNGGGGIKSFRKMYGDGNYKSYGEWLIENYGK